MGFKLDFSQLRAFDSNGDPVAGAKAYFYEPGTTTLRTVYSNAACTVAHPSPLEADASGTFAAVYSTLPVKVNITTSAGASVPGYPIDPVMSYGSIDATGALEIGAFSAIGASNGAKISDTVITSSRDTTGAATQFSSYNPNGLVMSWITSGTSGVIRSEGNFIVQTGGANSRVTFSNAAVTATTGVVFTGNGSGLTNLDAAAVSGNGSSISTLSSTAVGNAVAGLASGAVGTTVFARYTGATNPVAIGASVSGADLIGTDATGANGSTTLTGTWICAGRAATTSDATRTTLWRRTA